MDNRARLPVPGRSIWWLAGTMIGGLSLPPGGAAFIAGLAYNPIGGIFPPFAFFSLAGVILLIVGLGVLALLGSLIYSILSRSWRPIGLGVIFTVCMMLGFVPAVLCYKYTKRMGYDALAERSAPLVDAIRKYERAEGMPPSSLLEIVPAFLPEIPETGMAAYPEYEYAKEAGPCPPDNTWHLKVDAGEMLKWDFFFYCPRQNYTVDGWGGVNIPVRDWAYLDE